MESLLEENRGLFTEMDELMKKKNENDAEMSKLLSRLKMILGDKRCTIMEGHELDENLNYTKGAENSPFVKYDVIPSHSLGLTSRLAKIARYVFVEKSGASRLLEFFGVTTPRPVEKDEKFDKRKRFETETEDCLADEELKRCRPDQKFVWHDKETKEKLNVNGDIFEESSNVAPAHEFVWNKKPNINFVNNKVTGIKTISDAEDLIRDLTPKSKKNGIFLGSKDLLDDSAQKILITPSESFEEVSMDNLLMIEPSDSFGDNINKDLTGYMMKSAETSTPILFDQIPGLFVFSGSKLADLQAASSEAIAEDNLAEQSMLSGMTFEEKKVYFAQKIKDEEVAAMRGTTPLPALLGVKDLDS
eukprot:GFUD01024021.1.p1 GENE.GFUD01024021.1~~GFUD01024021.1.p1  ORF type:complete len:400 (-),score=111.62 GFUD01024021.1:71-1150(-)